MKTAHVEEIICCLWAIVALEAMQQGYNNFSAACFFKAATDLMCSFYISYREYFGINKP